jgi:hypothetical protein
MRNSDVGALPDSADSSVPVRSRSETALTIDDVALLVMSATAKNNPLQGHPQYEGACKRISQLLHEIREQYDALRDATPDRRRFKKPKWVLLRVDADSANEPSRPTDTTEESANTKPKAVGGDAA